MGRAGLENILEEIDMTERYVVTSAQKGARVNEELFESLQSYCVKNDAELLVFPLAGRTIVDEEVGVDERLQDYLVTRDKSLNQNIKLSTWNIKPQQINPLTGLKRFAQGDKTFIFGGTKQHLEYVPNNNDDLPKALMTTGSLTHPYYKTHTRIGAIAEKDHRYGAVLVEVEDNKFYHFRHLTSQKKGKFWDDGYLYDAGKVTKTKDTKALIVGDLHPYNTCPIHEAATMRQIAEYKPKKIVLHDAFNGLSINHHMERNALEQHEVFKSQGQSLGEELRYTREVLLKYAEAAKKVGGTVYVAKSNHDEFIDRYLKEGRFMGDKGNDLLGAQLYVEMLKGKDPLVAGLSMYGVLPRNLKFLDRSSSLKVAGYQLADHGDLGANGGRGSVRSIEAATGKSITAHGHTPFMYRDTYRVGTSTTLRLNYTRGYSGWLNTNAVIGGSGYPQLLNTINGKYKGGEF